MVRPGQTGASAFTASLPNLHGDTLLTTDGLGTNTSNGNGPYGTFTYDPFGNPLPGSHDPQNLDYASFAYAGAADKITETSITLNPIQMGARVYLPTVGIFTSMDPIPGGNATAYAYPLDPIDGSDWSGMQWTATLTGSMQNAAGATRVQPAAGATRVQPSAGASRVQAAAGAAINQRPTEIAARTQPATVHHEDTLRYAEPAGKVASVAGTASMVSTTYSTVASAASAVVIAVSNINYKELAGTAFAGCVGNEFTAGVTGLAAAPFTGGESLNAVADSAEANCASGAAAGIVYYFIAGGAQVHDQEETAREILEETFHGY